MSHRKSPVTSSGLRKYDTLDSETAVLKAWNDPGPNTEWHAACQREVRNSMPLLARALDRLTFEKTRDA